MPSAIVIGGGPAGSLSALLLARGGVTVRLFESHRFPRHKVCGECLSALGIEVLARAGLTDRLGALRPVRLTRSLVHPIDGPSLDLPLPRPMWGLSRHVMDECLLASAAEAGVTVHQPARCERVMNNARPTVVWRDLLSNEVRTETADWVVIADGKRTLFGTPPPLTGDLGIKAHFKHVAGPRDAVELFAARDCYGGLAPIEDDRWNAAFSLPAAVLKRYRGDVSAAFSAIVEQNPTLGQRLSGAHRDGAWLTCPLPRYAPLNDSPIGVVPVGNSAAAIEPIGGEGMGLALQSAETAASHITRSGLRGELYERYRKAWLSRQVICRIGAVVAGSSTCDSTATLLAQNPRIVCAAMAAAGK